MIILGITWLSYKLLLKFSNRKKKIDLVHLTRLCQVSKNQQSTFLSTRKKKIEEKFFPMSREPTIEFINPSIYHY